MAFIARGTKFQFTALPYLNEHFELGQEQVWNAWHWFGGNELRLTKIAEVAYTGLVGQFYYLLGLHNMGENHVKYSDIDTILLYKY